MRKGGIIALVLALLLSMTGCGQKKGLRMGTGGFGGTYYAFGTVLSQQMSEEAHPLSIDVKTTAGSAANLRLLREGFLQLAVVQSDLLSDAVHGTGQFSEQGAYSGYAAVAGLYTEACQIVVRADSDLQSVNDLAGRRVSVGEEESGVRKNAEEILDSHGISLEMIEPRYLSFADSAQALERGEIDAFFCTAGAPTNAVSDLAERMSIRLLSIAPEAQSNLIKRFAGYTACTVSADSYPGQTEEVSTVGVRAILVAASDADQQSVNAITRFLLEKGEALRTVTHGALTAQPEEAVQDVPCAFHPGSAEYYASKGIAVETASPASGRRLSGTQD